MKAQLFSFKIDSSKNLEENLDDFKKITVGLVNIDEKIFEENQAILLLNSLSDSYKDTKAAIKYDRESLTLDDVLGALRPRELEIKTKKKASSEGLQVRGRSQRSINKETVANQGQSQKGREPTSTITKKGT